MIFLEMGPPEFESESLAPKAKRIGQATLRARVLVLGINILYLKTFTEGRNCLFELDFTGIETRG